MKPQEFLNKVNKTGPIPENRPELGNCWIWEAGRMSAGYGCLGVFGQRFLAHRFSYLVGVGEIPEGLVIDHLCRNRLCVNPAHLEPVSQRVNMLRGVSVQAKNAVKTHCKHGHPLSGENLIIRKTTPNRLCNRDCRTCSRLRARKSWELRRCA